MSQTISAGCANMPEFVKHRFLVSAERSVLQQLYVLLDNCFSTRIHRDNVRYR